MRENVTMAADARQAFAAVLAGPATAQLVVGSARAVMDAAALHQTVADLARRVDRLGPSHSDPERFHIEKSEISAELRALARILNPRRPPSRVVP